jgi:hypothetical protein
VRQAPPTPVKGKAKLAAGVEEEVPEGGTDEPAEPELAPDPAPVDAAPEPVVSEPPEAVARPDPRPKRPSAAPTRQAVRAMLAMTRRLRRSASPGGPAAERRAQAPAIAATPTAASTKPPSWARWRRSPSTTRASTTVAAGYNEESTATIDSRPALIPAR